MSDALISAPRPSGGWFKSSYSAADNECVEVSFTATGASVRDSKSPSPSILTMTASSFTAFVEGLS